MADAAVNLRRVFAAARAARPDVAFDEGAFGAFLAARPERLEAAALTHAGDLALAFACAHGDDAALRVFDREFLRRVPDLLPARYRDLAPDVTQALRDKLLVPDEAGHTKIAEFSGRGGMSSWLRVTAVRVALNLQRSRRREVPFDEDRALAERAAGDMEMDHLKRQYRGEFKEAFAAALAALETRPRNLLRQHYLDGLTMEAIAGLYRVHRITVVRWMEQARAGLAKETRRELGARLRVDRRELESILRLIESQIDVTLRAFLGEERRRGAP